MLSLFTCKLLVNYSSYFKLFYITDSDYWNAKSILRKVAQMNEVIDVY